MELEELRPLPPRHVARPPQLYDVPQKSDVWLARRTEQTASQAGANSGLSPYDNSYPEYRYAVMAGMVEDTFRGNIHTDYGERYEDRVRHIQQVVFAMRVTANGPLRPITVVESGSFRSWRHRFQSCSLDGESNAIRIRGMHEDGRLFNWELGKLCCEDKTSRAHFYPTPRLPHIAQLQYQMSIMGRWWGILHYWSRDRTRIWLMRYDRYFVLWMQRRLMLLHEHVKRKVLVTRNNPYFAHRWKPGSRHYPGCSVADWLNQEWFDSAKRTEKALRPRITVQEWRDELRSLGMTQAEWDALYPEYSPRISWRDGREVCLDAGNLATPPQPEMYLVYEFERDIPRSEVEPADPVCLVNQDDQEWFRANFPPISEWAEHMLQRKAQGLPTHRDDERMQNLYITEVLPMPELDELEPQDAADQDSPEERAEFEQRLAAFRARAQTERSAPAPPRQQTLAAFCSQASAPSSREEMAARAALLWEGD